MRELREERFGRRPILSSVRNAAVSSSMLVLNVTVVPPLTELHLGKTEVKLMSLE